MQLNNCEIDHNDQIGFVYANKQMHITCVDEVKATAIAAPEPYCSCTPCNGGRFTTPPITCSGRAIGCSTDYAKGCYGLRTKDGVSGRCDCGKGKAGEPGAFTSPELYAVGGEVMGLDEGSSITLTLSLHSFGNERAAHRDAVQQVVVRHIASSPGTADGSKRYVVQYPSGNQDPKACPTCNRPKPKKATDM